MALPNQASHSHGMQLWHRIEDATGAFNELGEARDMNPPSITRSPIDTTPHSSAFKRFLPGGVADPGQVSFMLNEVVDDTGQRDLQSGVNGEEGRIDSWLMVRPNGKRNGFFGFITSYEPQTPDDDAITTNITVQVDGQWWETYKGEEVTDAYTRVAKITSALTTTNLGVGRIAQTGSGDLEWHIRPKAGDTARGLTAALDLQGATLVIARDESNFLSAQIERAEVVTIGSGANTAQAVKITLIEAAVTTGTVSTTQTGLTIEFG